MKTIHYLRSIPAIKNEVPPPNVPVAVLQDITANTQKMKEGPEPTTDKKSQSRKSAPARPREDR